MTWLQAQIKVLAGTEHRPCTNADVERNRTAQGLGMGNRQAAEGRNHVTMTGGMGSFWANDKWERRGRNFLNAQYAGWNNDVPRHDGT